MQLKCLTVFYMLTLSLFATPQNKTIVMEMGKEEGYPPYQFFDKGQPKGIMYDVLEVIAKKEGYAIIGRSFPKKRHELMIERGELDVVPNAKEWIDKSEDYLFSEPVIKARDLVFSLKGNPIVFTKIEDLFGKLAIGILGYSYPPLTKYFETGAILRHDTVDESQLIHMLFKYRGDFGIINELVGKWLIRQNGWQGEFLLSKRDVGSFEYRYMFSKQWESFMPKLSRHLQAMKSDGRLKKIIEQYQ